MNGKHIKKKLDKYQIAALLLTASMAGVLLLLFLSALKDGFSWKNDSEQAMVAPDFEAQDLRTEKKISDFTLPDRYGKKVSLSQFASADVLIVNLWSSDCPPCARELPSLAEMDRRLDELGKVALITITVDEKWEDVAGLFPLGTDLRVFFDPERKVVLDIFGTKLFPETFILDKQRRVSARFDGARDWQTPQMFTYIESFL